MQNLDTIVIELFPFQEGVDQNCYSAHTIEILHKDKKHFENYGYRKNLEKDFEEINRFKPFLTDCDFIPYLILKNSKKDCKKVVDKLNQTIIPLIWPYE